MIAHRILSGKVKEEAQIDYLLSKISYFDPYPIDPNIDAPYPSREPLAILDRHASFVGYGFSKDRDGDDQFLVVILFIDILSVKPRAYYVRFEPDLLDLLTPQALHRLIEEAVAATNAPRWRVSFAMHFGGTFRLKPTQSTYRAREAVVEHNLRIIRNWTTVYNAYGRPLIKNIKS